MFTVMCQIKNDALTYTYRVMPNGYKEAHACDITYSGSLFQALITR